MSDHSKALVPLETWTFASPELAAGGKLIDIGLFAEALIYYESLLVNVGSQQQLAALIGWFVDQNSLDQLLALLTDGTITLVDFSFLTTAIKIGSDFAIWNVQDVVQARPGTFDQRFLYHDAIRGVLPKSRHRERLLKACRGKVIELKADQFERGTENARLDALDPARERLVIQALVDEAYRIRGKPLPPRVEATVTPSADGSKHQVTWNVKIEELAATIGPAIGFHLGQPLTAIATTNRLIWASAGLNSDLYLGRPMDRLVGNKLDESARAVDATKELITDLQVEVEFPSIRDLVNAGQLSLGEVLTIRRKASRFRRWLQDEAERDRNALIAYHLEVAKETGLTRAGRHILSMFGIVGSGAAAGAMGTLVGGPAVGALVGGGTAGVGYLLDVASKLGADWRPVVFGNWLREQVRSDK